MSPDYRVTSDGLVVPHVAEVLENLVEIASRLEADFFVIGALARDIVLTKIHRQRGPRATGDVDVAIALDGWETFDLLTSTLQDQFGYRKTLNPFRFVSPRGAFVDIVPFGNIEDPKGLIRWPDDDSVRSSTVGLRAVSDATVVVNLDDRAIFKVATLPAIVCLKLIAWNENRILRPNDAPDIFDIMRRYDRILGKEFYRRHADILDADDHDYEVGSARALGRDVGSILRGSVEIADLLIRIVQEQTHDPEDSQLALDMGDSSGLDYPARFACLMGFRRGLEETTKE